MSATFHGSTEYIQQPDRREWDKANGWQTVRAWIGPREGSLPFAQTITADGAIKVTVADDGPTSTITASYPDIRDAASVNSEYGTELNVAWELDVSELEKDIVTHKAITPYNDGDRVDINEAKTAAADGKPMNPNWSAEASELYRFLSQGTTGYLVFAPILRKTIKVTDAAGVKASLDNVGRAGAAPADCPQILWDNPTATADGDAMQWLKKGPRVLEIGRGKYSIVQEWVGAKWSTILYGGNDSP
jgi:hypothetical protein